MSTFKRLKKVFKKSDELIINDKTKLILMSDCHRGNGSRSDNFLHNQNLFYGALTHYYSNDFIYIELGDGDELWENKKITDIINIHNDVFQILSRFHKKDRFYMLFGNHDIIKKKAEFAQKYIAFFDKIKIHEGLILKYDGKKIFLVHGHQGDFLNDTIWPVTRFLVRYLWKFLEHLGINDPTDTAKNYRAQNKTENKLLNYVEKEKQVLISGHTHRPVFPEIGERPYFNDGSLIHPHNITGIEIENGYISLIKWRVKTKEDGTMYVGKDTIKGPRKLKHYFYK